MLVSRSSATGFWLWQSWHRASRASIMQGNYTLVSGAIFAIVAVVQALRAFNQWPVQIASLDVPVWVSWAAMVVAGGLSAWAFRSPRP